MTKYQSVKLFTLATQALFTGGCLVILIVLVPFWQESNATDFLRWFSKNAPNIAKIMLPLEIVPLLLAMLNVYLVNKKKQPNRLWWWLNLLCNISILLMFFWYFMPANSSMASRAIADNQVTGQLINWKIFHFIRTALSAIGILFCVLGLTSSPSKDAENSENRKRNIQR